MLLLIVMRHFARAPAAPVRGRSRRAEAVEAGGIIRPLWAALSTFLLCLFLRDAAWAGIDYRRLPDYRNTDYFFSIIRVIRAIRG
jgi:hypothetical protein